MVIEEPTYQLELDPGWIAVAEPLDAASTETLSRRFSDATPGRVAVQVAPTDTFDVSGHAAGGATIDVVLTIGDDVEGHAFSLRFPTPQDAERMRTRLAAGGLLVAALTVASIGVGSQLAAPQVGAPAHAAAPAVEAPLTVSPAWKADLRYPDRDQEAGAPAQAAPAAAAPLTVSPAWKADLRYPDRDGSGESTDQSNTSSDVPGHPQELDHVATSRKRGPARAGPRFRTPRHNAAVLGGTGRRPGGRSHIWRHGWRSLPRHVAASCSRRA